MMQEQDILTLTLNATTANTIDITAIETTISFTQSLASTVQRGDMVLLSGDLGTGKTTIAQWLIRALLADESAEVTSPTFTIVNEYFSQSPPCSNPNPKPQELSGARTRQELGMAIAHCDLYRLNSFEELEAIGLIDIIRSSAAVVIVEWPDLLPDGLIAQVAAAGHKVIVVQIDIEIPIPMPIHRHIQDIQSQRRLATVTMLG